MVAQPDAGSRPPGRARAGILIAGLFLALTLLFTFPLWLHPTERVVWHGSDTELFAWTLSWDVHALTHAPWSIFDANIYYPQRRTLAYSENLIGSAILAAPALWLTGSAVAAINAVSILTTLLCGIGAYVLARRTGVGRPAAVLAGIVFAFAPPRFLRLGQLHLAAVQWVPLGLAVWHRYLDERRALDLRLAALFFTLEALSSGHGTVFLLVAMVALLVYRVAVEPRRLAVLGTWHGLSSTATGVVRDLGLPGLIALAPTVLVLVEYRIVQREMGLARTLDDWVRTNFASFYSSPSHVHVFLHNHAPGHLDAPQADLFPGYLPILLAPLAFLRRSGRAAGPAASVGAPRDTWFFALLTAGTLWLALPLEAPLGLWPHVYWLPGLNFIRVPSRFTILTVLGLAVLLAHAVERMSASWPARRRLGLAMVVGVLLVGEFAAWPVDAATYSANVPAVDRALAKLPTPFVVAEVPVGDPDGNSTAFERRQSTFMVHSTAHFQKTIHGFSGMRPPLHEKLFGDLWRFPDDDVLTSLEQLGVTYVVVHSEDYEPEKWQRVQERLAALGDRLKLEEIVGPGRIYRLLRARPQR